MNLVDFRFPSVRFLSPALLSAALLSGAALVACDGGSTEDTADRGEGGAGGTGGSAPATGGAPAAGGAPAVGGAPAAGGAVSEDGGAGGEGGESGGDGDGGDGEPEVPERIDIGFDWTVQGDTALVARPGGGSALRLRTTAGVCNGSSIQQTVTVPESATALRVTFWSDNDMDGSSMQAWMSLRYSLAIFSDMETTEPTEHVYCVPEEMRGEELTLAVVARTQAGDCAEALTIYVDDFAWDTTSPTCVDLQ